MRRTRMPEWWRSSLKGWVGRRQVTKGLPATLKGFSFIPRDNRRFVLASVWKMTAVQWAEREEVVGKLEVGRPATHQLRRSQWNFDSILHSTYSLTALSTQPPSTKLVCNVPRKGCFFLYPFVCLGKESILWLYSLPPLKHPVWFLSNLRTSPPAVQNPHLPTCTHWDAVSWAEHWSLGFLPGLKLHSGRGAHNRVIHPSKH